MIILFLSSLISVWSHNIFQYSIISLLCHNLFSRDPLYLHNASILPSIIFRFHFPIISTACKFCCLSCPPFFHCHTRPNFSISWARLGPAVSWPNTHKLLLLQTPKVSLFSRGWRSVAAGLLLLSVASKLSWATDWPPGEVWRLIWINTE